MGTEAASSALAAATQLQDVKHRRVLEWLDAQWTEVDRLKIFEHVLKAVRYASPYMISGRSELACKAAFRSVYQQHFAQVVNNAAVIDRYICPPDDYLAVRSPDYFTWREIRTILAVTNQIARRVDFTGVVPGRGHRGCVIGWRDLYDDIKPREPSRYAITGSGYLQDWRVAKESTETRI